MNQNHFDCSKRMPNIFQNHRRLRSIDVSEKNKEYGGPTKTSEERKQTVDQSTRCVFCKKKLNGETVIHLNHITDKMYMISLYSCKLRLPTQNFTPISFTTSAKMVSSSTKNH